MPLYPMIGFRVNQTEFNRFKALKDAGYSAREVLEIIFEKATNSTITVLDKKNGKPVKFPSNLISKKNR